MSLRSRIFLIALAASAAWLTALAARPAVAQSIVDPFLEQLTEPAMRELVNEMLQRNPRAAAAEASAKVASYRSDQVGALPDLSVSFTAFVEEPETRVGPQEWTMSASQALPWRGKRRGRAEAADFDAAALAAETEAVQLSLLTELRVQLLELAFLDQLTEINQTNRQHLLQHEQIARARYATGSGPGQGVLKLQAAITSIDHRLLGLQSREFELEARINALRDRPPTAPLPRPTSATPEPFALAVDKLVALAVSIRPDLRAAQLRIDRTHTIERLADLDSRPDFRVGVTYTQVGRRQDEVGILQPPPGNGNDILGIQGAISLPVWRSRLFAGLDQAAEETRLKEEQRRVLKADLEREVSDLGQQIPIRWQQLRLIREVLILQAQEALDLATSGYISGSLNALDLLDAEHVLFEAQTAVARAETDYLIALIRLEGALGLPLSAIPQEAAP